MAQYDLYNMEDRLKRRFPMVTRIDYNRRTKRHHIIAKDKHDHEYTMFTVPLGELDGRVEFEIVKITAPRYSAVKELEAAEAKRERDNDNRVSDMTRDIADILYEPLMRDAFG